MDKETQALKVVLPSDLHRAAKIKSAACGESLRSVVERKLQEWVDEPTGSKKPSKSGC